jgi:hypothetical protein
VQPRRLHVGGLARIYVAAALILTGLVLYLVQTAHVTETAYEIERLKSQQSDLLSEQEQLRYREASMQAPARFGQEAAAQGFERVTPGRYLPHEDVTLGDVSSPQVASGAEQPVWQRLLALIGSSLGGSQDALAGD